MTEKFWDGRHPIPRCLLFEFSICLPLSWKQILKAGIHKDNPKFSIVTVEQNFVNLQRDNM
jgi:hypothetical protein